MNCPHCSSAATTQQLPSDLGRLHLATRCSVVSVVEIAIESSTSAPVTGTQFNHLQFPTDIVLLVVMWRLRYKLSLRDLSEMFLVRGFEFTHEAVRNWEAKFAPLITKQLRARRKGKAKG